MTSRFHYELVCKLGFGTESNSDYTGGYLVKDSDGEGTADISI